MLALYNLLPLYCPSCGTPTCLDRVDNPLAGKFKAKQAVSCAICGRYFPTEQIKQQTLAD
jgi:transcription elongation factor Elf1